MDRFTLFLSHGNISKAIKELNCCKDETSSEREPNYTQFDEQDSSLLNLLASTCRHFIAFCNLNSSQYDNSIINKKWIEISSELINEDIDDCGLTIKLIDYYHKSCKDSVDRISSKAFEDPIDGLHQLADDLPILGSYILEVIIITNSREEFLSPEDNISFYGFLERLQLWHQATINVLNLENLFTTETETPSSSQFDSWNDVITFGKIMNNSFSLKTRPSILWSGSFCLRNENGCHSRIYGLELRNYSFMNNGACYRTKCEDAPSQLLLSDEIEVLKVIEDYDAPLHVYCSKRLKLTLRQDCDDSSKYFFNVVHQSREDNLCFLACMFYNDVTVHTKPDQELSTKKWLDYINDKNTEYLVPDDWRTQLPKRCMIMIRGCYDADSLDVFFLKDSKFFCGIGLQGFLSHEHSLSIRQARSPVQVKWKLPVISDEDITQVQLDYLENLRGLLEEGNNNEIEGCGFSERFDLNAIFEKSSNFICIDDDDNDDNNNDHDNDNDDDDDDGGGCGYDYFAAGIISPSKWPERLSWNNQEISASISLRGSLKRFQSAENHMKLKGIPVAAEKHCEDVAETFSKIQELFDSTGRPIKTDLKNIPLVADRLFKQLPNEETVKVLPFVEAKQFIGHGIDYCLDTHNSLKLDAKIVRIQERFISDDTCCSWTQKTNQTTKQRSTCERKQNVVTCDGKNIKIARNKERELQNDKPGKKVRSHIPKEPKKKKKFVSKPKDDDAISKCPSKETRSQRHQRRLKVICEGTLQKYGQLKTDDPLFEKCVARLFTLCKSFLKDLKTSEGLINEMKRLAKSNVNQVVEFERRGR